MPRRQPNSQFEDELIEYPYVGPFGGVQSEVQLDQIGRTGFAEVQNIMFRKAQARVMPGFEVLPSPSGEQVIGIGDFFDAHGAQHFVVWTPNGMYNYDGASGTWNHIAQPAPPVLLGNPAFVAWDVVGYKLYFTQPNPAGPSQQTIGMWDGINPISEVGAGGGSVIVPSPAKYLCEIGFHLVEANTTELDGPAPNRIKWSTIGDGTDWNDPVHGGTAGQADLFNNLGPINGLARVYQTGYAFQQWGITQIIPTGIGTAPFEFVSMGSRAKGCIVPYGLASFGEIVACYPGKNDIYLFDGTEAQPIGSRAIDGNRRLGARVRIFQDLFIADQTNIFGYILTSANGNDYESYWIFIPSLNKAWVYHFDEGSWTQELFQPKRLVGPAGTAPLAAVMRWMDVPKPWNSMGLVAWESLNNANEMDTMVISDGLANSVSFFAFEVPNTAPTTNSINAGDGFYIRSGTLHFEDPRHYHTMKKLRLLLQDFGPVTISLRFTNEKGQIDGPQQLTYGDGSGKTLTRVISVALPGNYLTWELSGPPNVGWGMTEITPVIDVAGEVQMGVR